MQTAGKTLLRIIFSALLMELTLHTTSTFQLHAHYNQVKDWFTPGSLVMSLTLKGGLFACKYIVFYGAGYMLNDLVGMRVTPLPQCVSLMHTNREMWRFFDTGIYEFIKK